MVIQFLQEIKPPVLPRWIPSEVHVQLYMAQQFNALKTCLLCHAGLHTTSLMLLLGNALKWSLQDLLFKFLYFLILIFLGRILLSLVVLIDANKQFNLFSTFSML